MELDIYQVDAFGKGSFTGNPAAVIPLSGSWLPDNVLVALAEENNLSETAFILQDGEEWYLRWFTPKQEVALCGHATLGAAHAIHEFIDRDVSEIRFKTKESGTLTVKREKSSYEISFPAIPSIKQEHSEDLAAALGLQPLEIFVGKYSDTEWDFVAVFGSQEEIEGLRPDLNVVSELGSRGVICTAPGNKSDFVSRYFAPSVGVSEDPATGSAHCILAPLWAGKLNKPHLDAWQISKRGGWIGCIVDQDTVRLSGQAYTYLKGNVSIELPQSHEQSLSLDLPTDPVGYSGIEPSEDKEQIAA